MATIISSIGSVLTGIAGQVSTVVGTITAEGNELLLYGCLLGFSFTAVTLFKRLLH